jgi:hypothetical protein
MRTAKMPIAMQLANLSRFIVSCSNFIVVNKDRIEALALKGAVVSTFCIASSMVFHGGWGVLKFFLVQVWPIFKEIMKRGIYEHI